MQRLQIKIYYLLLMLLMFSSLKVYADPIPTLTLDQVEALALDHAPELLELLHQSQAAEAAAVAAGQFADPKLIAGIENLPVNSFSFTQDEMTMIFVGLEQAFPKGKSLSINAKQQQLQAEVINLRQQDMRATILREARTEWLELYYRQHSLTIIGRNQRAFEHLVEVTESMLAAGINNQADVFQAQLQLSKTQQQRIDIEQALALSQARLVRWLGQDIDMELPDQLPEFAPLPDKNDLQQALINHPKLKADSTRIEVEEQGVQYAREQYKPGITAALGYGFRQGRMGFDNQPGPRRSDMVSLNLALDLPVFPGKRQSKTLLAAQKTRNATEQARASAYRQINSEFNQQYARWQNLNEQSQHYVSTLVPQSQQFSQSTLNAYQSNLTDFNQVIDAYVTAMNTELDQLQIEVEKNKSRTALLYLEEGL